jgi:hypothetical protein
MYTIYNYYNNNHLFKAGFLIGAGFAFMISGTINLFFGSYYMIKHGFFK